MKWIGDSVLFTMYCVGAIVCGFLQANLVGQDERAGKEILYRIEPPFAWNRPDRYAPPNAEAFFPDDDEGGKELTLCVDGKQQWPADIDERLALVRRGLRRMRGHKTLILGSLGNEFIWNKEPQDERAIELMYHASDLREPELAGSAFYHGPSVVSNRSPNLVRALMEQYQARGEQDQGRIAWGMKTYGDKDQTRRLLLEFLDGHETMDDSAVCAAIDTYQAVFDTMPPEMTRFDRVGKWVVAFHRTDLSATHPRAAQILREQTTRLMRGREELLLDFVTRVDEGHETAVLLLQGVQARQDFVIRLNQYLFTKVDFKLLLSPRILREYRLREFARHLPHGLPDKCLPEYTRPGVDETFAFNAGTFVPPEFSAYFADDPEAGQQLDQVYDHHDQVTLKDRELLALFRRGVRRSTKTPNMLFGWISGSLGWPTDPLLKEIFYQATDARAPFAVRDAAVYYGYNLNSPKTRNMLEVLFQAYMSPPFDRTTNGNFRTRILWSIRDHEDDKYYLATRFAAALQNHAELSDDALRQADTAYRQLAGTEPPNGQEFDARIVNLVGFVARRMHSVEEAKKRVQERLGNPEYWLDAEFKQEQDDVQVLAVVRGHAAVQTMSEKLKVEPEWALQLVLPLTRELLEETGDKLPSRFEKHLPTRK